MSKNSSMSLRINPQVKADVEAIYSRYGLSITEAINVGGLPFDLRPPRPNEFTLAAMREGDEIVKSGQGRFIRANDLLEDLKS